MEWIEIITNEEGLGIVGDDSNLLKLLQRRKDYYLLGHSSLPKSVKEGKDRLGEIIKEDQDYKSI